MSHITRPLSPESEATVALALRVGLGLVFVSGGVAKLERLLTPTKAQGIVDQYVGPLGYINQTFLDWLFASPLGLVLTPWNFLTLLSAFEVVAGVMLIAGLMVRPLALLWAFLLWSFVVSLPVVTTPGVTPPAKTYMSPAELVQIRDITLSGLFFALYNMGAGARSLDAAWFGQPEALGRDWEALGLLVRLSLGASFLIGGLFAGYDNVVTWGLPGVVLAVVGAGLIAGVGTRWFAMAAAGLMLWFMMVRLGSATGVIGWFNAVKREFALLAAAGVIAWVGSGRMFAVDRSFAALAAWWATYAGGAQAARHDTRRPAE